MTAGQRQAGVSLLKKNDMTWIKELMTIVWVI